MILAFYSKTSGAGKDTAADVAANHLHTGGVQVVRDAFAWDGKVVCADALGIEGARQEKVAAIDRIKLEGRVAWEAYIGTQDAQWSAVTGRDFIIGLLGSPDQGNGIRGLDESFWTRQVVDRAREHAMREYRRNEILGWTVVSDLRFLEEAEAVRKSGGAIIEIVRPTDNLGTFNEQDVEPDYVIVNDSTLEALASRVVGVVREISRDRRP